MPSERSGFQVDYRSVAQPPLAACRSLLVRVAGAVIVSALLTWVLPKPSRYYWQMWVMAERSEVVWGVEVVQPFFFFLTRVTSPFVAGPVVLAGVLAVVFEYRRRR